MRFAQKLRKNADEIAAEVAIFLLVISYIFIVLSPLLILLYNVLYITTDALIFKIKCLSNISGR